MHGLYEPHFGLERTLPIMTPSINYSFELSILPGMCFRRFFRTAQSL
jgi:hypothetical protein